MSGEFAKLLRKAQDIAVREIRDGCNECRAIRGVCRAHIEEVTDIVVSPSKSERVQDILGSAKARRR